MPVEIRELVIKTQIHAQHKKGAIDFDGADIQALKRQIINECRQVFKAKTQTSNFNR